MKNLKQNLKKINNNIQQYIKKVTKSIQKTTKKLTKKTKIIIGASLAVLLALIIILKVSFNNPSDAKLEDLKITNLEVKNDGHLLTGKIENNGSNVDGVMIRATVYDGNKVATIIRIVTYFNQDKIGNFSASSSVKIPDNYKIEYEVVEYY